MVLTSRGGNPTEIVEALHERRKEFWQIPGISPAAKTAVAKVADILEDLIRAGELPKPIQSEGEEFPTAVVSPAPQCDCGPTDENGLLYADVDCTCGWKAYVEAWQAAARKEHPTPVSGV